MIYAVLYVAVLGLVASLGLMAISPDILRLVLIPALIGCTFAAMWCGVILYTRRTVRRRQLGDVS